MSLDLWAAGRDPGEAIADIVVPVYNQVAYTRDCLASLRECTDYPYRLIVVDNACRDETPELLRTLADEGLALEVITNSENLGFTKAANQGLRASRGRYVVLLNNDTTLTRGWLTGLVMTAECDDRIGIVGPKILNPETERIHSIGGLLFHKARVEAPPGQDCARDDPRFAHGFDCQYVEGSCMLIKRSVLDAIGYLDEVFSPGYYEDTDYCFRAREAGFRLVYSPYAEIYHYSTVTARAVQRENPSLSAAAQRNDRVFRARWVHRFR